MQGTGRNWTELDENGRNCTELDGTRRNCTELHETTRKCIQMHGTGRNWTELHENGRNYTELHEIARNCTELHGNSRIETKKTQLKNQMERNVMLSDGKNKTILNGTDFFHLIVFYRHVVCMITWRIARR